MKKKILLSMILISFIVFFSGITYSFFNSTAELNSSNQKIASFIFETQNLEKIDLNLDGLKPGDEKEFKFLIRLKNCIMFDVFSIIAKKPILKETKMKFFATLFYIPSFIVAKALICKFKRK